MTEMRVLTVRQPWAWAIIHGGKDVENRVRNIAGDYRGPVAIHAGLADNLAEWKRLCAHDFEAWCRAMDARESLIGGAIIGVVDLANAHVCKSHSGVLDMPVCFDSGTPYAMTCSPWAQFRPGEVTHHLMLKNPRPLAEPIPFRGALGLRRLDPATHLLVESEL